MFRSFLSRLYAVYIGFGFGLLIDKEWYIATPKWSRENDWDKLKLDSGVRQNNEVPFKTMLWPFFG